jgi:hypothetical protein
VTQQWNSGLFNSQNNFYTLARSLTWQSSAQSGAGGYYQLGNGDSCGGSVGARSGTLYLQCAASSGFWVYEPSICRYNITYYGPSGCVGAVGVIKNSAANSAYCMSAAGTAPGSAVTMQPCNGAAASQQMVMRSDQSIYNPASGLCVDLKGGVYSANVPLQLSACNGAASQQFKVPSSFPGTFASSTGAYCMTGGATVSANTPVGLNTCSSSNKNWLFVQNS